MATWTPTQSGSRVNGDFGLNRSIGYQFQTGNPVIGSAITAASFELVAPASTPSAYDMYVKIYSSTGTLEDTSTNSFPAANVTSTPTIYTWTFSGGHTIVDGDYIALGNTGDSGANIQMQMLNTSSDNYEACRQNIGAAISLLSPARYPEGVTVTYGTAPPPSSSNLLFPPPVAYI